MFDLFGNVKNIINLSKITIDNNVFKLHYKFTCSLLVVCSLIVTSKQYIGDPIDCVVEEIPQKMMDTYCWIHSTFSIPNRVIGTNGLDIAHPGVAPNSDLEEGTNVRYHKYYQWVCFTLFFQAILFYLPHYIWKSLEKGRVKLHLQDMDKPIVDPSTKEERIKILVDFFVYNKNVSKKYAFYFFLCEVLNFINVVGQIFFMDLFLGGEFRKYGTEIFSITELAPEDRTDPMSRVFPKVAKCTFNKYGPSGTIQNFDGLCVLPLNIVIEKIYALLWFWFCLVSFISAVMLVYRILAMTVPSVREMILRSKCKLYRATMNHEIHGICGHLPFGDWFFLNQLCKNMDPITRKQFIEALLQGLENPDETKSLL